MEHFDTRIKKDVLELLVLAAVADAPSYGHALLGELGQRSNGSFAFKESDLYPVLYRLEDAGSVVSEQRQAPGDMAAKKYYRITPEGGLRLQQMLAAWEQLSACVSGMLLAGWSREEEAEA